MDNVSVPRPKIKQRPLNPMIHEAGLKKGLDPIIVRILAGRPCPEGDNILDQLLSPALAKLAPPFLLADMAVAVKRLVEAIKNEECIGIETDHDCDGQTSHAVIYSILTEVIGYPVEKIRSYIGHRLKEGYGLSDSVVQRILKDSPRPHLIITADNGSADEPRIAQLKAFGIDTIVTDHHQIPEEGIPKSAIAVLNPTREDCEYPDHYIAGCMVAWLLMAGVKRALIEERLISEQGPSLANYLDFVAVGTVADCVSLARSHNNRAVINHGLKLINQGKRPCWRAVLPLCNNQVNAEDLGFRIGPLLNSDGRLDSAMGSVSFLLSHHDEEAQNWLKTLQNHNENRKKIQAELTQQALIQASEQAKKGKHGLCILLEEGHSGVHGISASRIKDAFGRPTFIFCPKQNEPDLLTGSGRGIDDFHVRDALCYAYEKYPNSIKSFGGHKGAAGITVWREYFSLFCEAFEEYCQKSLNENQVGPVIWTDGEMASFEFSIENVEKVCNTLSPFGREFEYPIFEIRAAILTIHFVGEEKQHAKCLLGYENKEIDAIWFNAPKDLHGELPVVCGEICHLIIAPKINTFRGSKRLSAHIIDIIP